MDAALSTKADVANVYDRTQLYTQIETNNLLNNKQNNLSTLLGDDATTFQILNGTKIKALREGSNIQLTALTGGDEIQIEAIIPTVDLSDYYTRSEADILLNGKLNTNNPTITGTVTHTHSSQPHYTFNTTTTNPLVPTEFYIDRRSLDASLHSAFGMGDTSRGFFVWVNGGDRLNIGTNGNTTFSGNVTAPNLYDRTYVDAALSTKANVANVYDRTQLYTQIETNGLLTNKQNNLSTLLGDDATTFQILNGTKVKALREGSNIQMTSLIGGDEIEIEAVIPPTDLSDYYTKTEVDNSLASKQSALSTIPRNIATLTYPVLNDNEVRALRSSNHISMTLSPDDGAITISTIGMYNVGETNTAIQTALDTKVVYEIQEIHSLQEDAITVAKSIDFIAGRLVCSVDASFSEAVHTPLLDATNVVAGVVSCGVVNQSSLPAFQVRKTNGVVYSTVGTIAFNDVVLNQGNCFSGSTFTAPSVGVYHFHFMCQSVNVPLEISMKSGTTTLFSRYSGIGQDSGSGAVTVYLIANQTVHLELISGSFWAGNNDTCINFGGHKCG